MQKFPGDYVNWYINQKIITFKMMKDNYELVKISNYFKDEFNVLSKKQQKREVCSSACDLILKGWSRLIEMN